MGRFFVMRLLIECTYVFDHPGDNSGIQRVVRNIVRELPNVDSQVECIPVILSGGRVHQVLQLASTKVHIGRAQIKWSIARLIAARHQFWRGYGYLDRLVSVSHTLRRILFVVSKAISLSLTLPILGLAKLDRRIPDPDRTRILDVAAGDQLVLLDSSWYSDFFKLAEELQTQGVGVVAVVYDLIPLTHPQFCDARLVKVFDEWFNWIANTADGFVTISRCGSGHCPVVQAFQAGIRSRFSAPGFEGE